MEKITFNGELILTLESKQEWVNKIPNHLPEKRYAEQRLWLDKNGNCLTIGEDFAAAEKAESYPVRVYSLQRVAEAETATPEPELYYIRTRGYIGNGLVWWRPNNAGYTSDLKQAGKYTYDKAFSICQGSHGDSLAYSCSKVDNLPEGLITQLHADYVPKPDIGTRFGEERKEPASINQNPVTSNQHPASSNQYPAT
jgi:hypothetical protein